MVDKINPGVTLFFRLILLCNAMCTALIMENQLCPADIACSEQVFDLSFHPTSDYLAAGLIDGVIEIWQYGAADGANQLALRLQNHTSSCRGLMFNSQGSALYSISSDKSLRGMDGGGRELFCITNAHNSAINRMCTLSDDLIVTGDDTGIIKLWDIRTVGEPATVVQWHHHEDYIAGLAYNHDSCTLISISGDSTLCAYDIRNTSSFFRSEQQESELQCIEIVKNGEHIVAGTQDGLILTFAMDTLDDCIDSFPGHPEPVDCMWKVDESTVITGSSDGLLRVVSLHPNKILGVIGDHEEFPVEGMCASRDGLVLASFAHDEVVRFWDISMLGSDDYRQAWSQQQGSGSESFFL